MLAARPLSSGKGAPGWSKPLSPCQYPQLRHRLPPVPGVLLPAPSRTEWKAHRYYVAAVGDACARDRECRSEEHTSELQSRGHLVCRLLLEKKNIETSLIECFTN